MGFGRWARAALPVAVLTFATTAGAQTGGPVTLKTEDGFTRLRGEILEFDGQTYTLRTPLGVLDIDAMQVECEGEACPENPLFGSDFGVVGSNTIGTGLLPTLIQGYADMLDAELVREYGAEDTESVFRILHDDGREMAAIRLDAEGSGASFDALAQGRAALGLSSRRARDADVQMLSEAGYDDPRDTGTEHVVALDGLVAITHPANPVRSISIGDLARVFSGEISDWAQLGGPRTPIKVFARNDGSGTLDTFETLVMTPAGASLTPLAERFDSDLELSDAVASDAAAIGFTTLASTRASKPLGVRQSCGLLSLPTTFAIKTEEYPLSRRLYVYESPEEKPAHARRLLDFALSSDAQPLIQEAGFIDSAPETAALDEMGGRIVYSLTTEDEFSLPAMREMLSELQNAERLSTTFRFTPGSSQLDPLSQREANSLAQNLANGDFDGKQVLLVGFTDAIGEFDLNQQLGNRRAGVVLEALRQAAGGALGRVEIATRGYGELMPVGCNETFGGRLANRRVEVWVRDVPQT
ncbi:MAG TPA: phosphate ABC transporter substrate-binding/OmpA family protein [Thermohalobaculum sp.]|nr:phosphate ABC transporter substrate-binding/OmpA family protein [Thermohalobaculum sp.]